MQSRIVLISDDSDFFEYIFPKLELRKNDELFRFKFDELPDKLHMLETSVLIINSEKSESRTIELLQILKDTPAVIFGYNADDEFRINTLKNGAAAFVTPLTSDDEFKASLVSALKLASILEKNKQDRAILVKKNLILPNNEVLLDYTSVLDRELEKLNASSSIAVLAAISPNDKTKFLIQPNQIETIILNNIRKNDILMNYAVNKYFLLLFDTDIDGAQRIWAKIQSQIPEKIYAGFTKTFSKTRQQLVNEVLNKLHEAINYEKVYSNMTAAQSNVPRTNFKMFKQEFNKKIERIINPVFYHIRQKYNDKLFGVTIEQENIEGGTILHLKGRHAVAAFKMTSPGFSKINIDITFSSSPENIDAKRISLNPDELEAGVLEDLLEQFIAEFRKEVNNDNTKYR